MADISDVENALCDQILAAVYPLGILNDSITGQIVKIYRGWPLSRTLNIDLMAGIQNITIFSRSNSTIDTSRYSRTWKTINKNPSTIVIGVSGDIVILSGDVGVSQNIGLIVDGIGYAFTVAITDTLVSIAQSLADIVPSAFANENIITIPGAMRIEARVVGSGIAEMETRRQQQGIMVSVWAPTPMSRDKLAAAIDNALSNVDWLSLADGSMGRLRYHSTTEIDTSENASLYRRNLDYTVEYPTTIQMTGSEMLFGIGTLAGSGPEVGFSLLSPPSRLVIPPLGAIRFDAWYDPSNVIDQQCANALSPLQYQTRLPSNAILTEGSAFWPYATQDTIDFEISAAVKTGLSFWAFDSYQPDDTLSLALALYLSSSLRSKLRFCMLGQSSNWGEGGRDQPSLLRDIAMMTQAGYMKVLDERPLYLVLDAPAEDLGGLPKGGVAAAIALVRRSVQAAGGKDPYVIWLSGASLLDYSNVAAAQAAGADATGAYCVPRLIGSPQPYSSLVAATEADWAARALSGFPMVPTGMTGWDQRPLISNPQPFYPISNALSLDNYYETAESPELASHMLGLVAAVNANVATCPAQVGLVYAWNELAEGGWLMPTYTAAGPNISRVTEIGQAFASAISASSMPSLALIR